MLIKRMKFSKLSKDAVSVLHCCDKLLKKSQTIMIFL